jgi:hypothetical protein
MTVGGDGRRDEEEERGCGAVILHGRLLSFDSFLGTPCCVERGRVRCHDSTALVHRHPGRASAWPPPAAARPAAAARAQQSGGAVASNSREGWGARWSAVGPSWASLIS